ncbi:MAG: IS66 family transposase [Acidobacteriota bacterium]|nr:IS66 family transposase [Acidobacteriota bacterium]
MTREQLEQLSKAELVEIVLGLQARLAAVEDQIKRLTQPPKDSSNSSTPPSKTRKPNRPANKPKKKRGPKPGHEGRSRKREDPDVIVECRPASCDHCGADLRQAGGRLLGASQVVEMPPMRPVVIEARRYGCACANCGRRQAGQYPAGLEPQRVFGPRLEALVCYLHHVQHVSYERLESLLRALLGLRLSQGAIANIIARAAVGLRAEAEAIGEQVRASPVIGSDETGARVDGRNRWQWVFETAQASFHLIAHSRAARVIADFMGDAVPGVWVSDCFSAQLKAPTQARQLCHAHQLRDLQFAVDAERSRFAYEMQRLLLTAQGLARRRAHLPADVFAGQVATVETTCDALLSAPASGRHGRRLQKRYRKHREALFTFLYRDDVPPDNNACERALRKSVVHRKVSGGFRSDWGAAAFATMATVTETAAKRGEDALGVLTKLLTPAAALVPLPQPP